MSRVLIVTIILVGRTGTEVVCCETARGLRRRHHEVIVYTQRDGPTADALRAEGFQVTTDLASLTAAPDVIQANQTYPLLEAIGRFPKVPAISICHDATVWYTEPVDPPAIRRHVAVDLACRDRIAGRLPHLTDRIEILHNAVDLDGYRPRAPLPPRPKRALILAKHSSYLGAIHAACLRRGIGVDILGAVVGNEVDDLPSFLRDYDLVFASARAALEAMAVGCAVVVVDSRGLAGLVTHDVVSSWRENNFGLRLLSRPPTMELIGAEIDRYDAADAGAVSRFIREHSSLDRYLDRLESLHREVIAEGVAAPVDADELVYRLSRSLRPLEHAWRAQREREFQDFVRSREQDLEREHRTLAHAREAELNAACGERIRAREAELRAEFEALRAWTAPRNLPRRIINKVRRHLFGA